MRRGKPGERMSIKGRNTRWPANGFTLIEVMIAFVVLLFGMLGIIGMQYYSVTGNAASRELRIATNRAEELIEQLKSTPYANIASGTDDPAEDAVISGNVNYTRAWWVIGDCVSLEFQGGNDDGTCNPALAVACTQDPDAASVVPVSVIRARTCWTDVKTGVNHSVTLDSMRWNENAIP